MLIGKSKKEAMPTAKFRELCRQHASKFVDIQRDGFKSLGVIADWNNPARKWAVNIYDLMLNYNWHHSEASIGSDIEAYKKLSDYIWC
jgi:ribonucleotide reductase beta subunit family protein with ferritin-like domain